MDDKSLQDFLHRLDLVVAERFDDDLSMIEREFTCCYEYFVECESNEYLQFEGLREIANRLLVLAVEKGHSKDECQSRYRRKRSLGTCEPISEWLVLSQYVRYLIRNQEPEEARELLIGLRADFLYDVEGCAEAVSAIDQVIDSLTENRP